MRIYRPDKWGFTYTSNPEGSLVGFEDWPSKEDAERAQEEKRRERYLVHELRHEKAITDPKHYHAMNGSHGYLPDSSDACETYSAAVDTLVSRFELGKKRARILRRDGYIELNSSRDGAEYAEVSECTEEECWQGPEGLNGSEAKWIRDAYPADEYEEPQEPGEEDITCDDPAGPFYYLGKKIAENVTELKAWMQENNYWPDVWFVSDHGNAHLITDKLD